MPTETFKARAHILKLLGDELIGNDQLAVFELVKNSYDADANNVTVTLDLDREKPCIIIEDDGAGMSLDTLRKGWFEIGSALKRGENRKPSAKYGRTPLGEKGVGRLAAHKLGKIINIVTRAKSSPEYHFTLNWTKLAKDDAFLGKRKIPLRMYRKPRVFIGNKFGTKITITQMKRTEWTRGGVRTLKRMVTSLASPFEAPDSFMVTLNVPGHDDWVEDLFELDDFLESAIWRFDFSINGEYFNWSYRFNPPPVFKILESQNKRSDPDEFTNKLDLLPDNPRKKKKIFMEPGDLKGIGPINGIIYVFDRRSKVLGLTGQSKQLTQFLDEQMGVRVYRDGVRVYNYGEPWDDWLGLNADRINRPAKKMGTNSVIAAIHLASGDSYGLHEKTNREGFDENETYEMFRKIVRSAISFLDRLRRQDRENLDKAVKGGSSSLSKGPEKFDRNINLLRKELKRHGLDKKLGPRVDSIEQGYTEMRDILMTSGAAGLNLALVFHEIERGIKTLRKGISNREPVDKLEQLANHLSELLEGFAPLLKKSQIRTVPISTLLQRVISIVESRLKAHEVVCSCPVLTGEDFDFEITGAVNLYLAAIINLVDNAIYWVRRERAKGKGGNHSAIALRTFPDWAAEGPSLVVADSGTGFSIDPAVAIKPFVSDRAGGMGLGLYYANLVMESQGGDLMVVDRRDLELPAHLKGAAVVMRFRRNVR